MASKKAERQSFALSLRLVVVAIPALLLACAVLLAMVLEASVHNRRIAAAQDQAVNLARLLAAGQNQSIIATRPLLAALAALPPIRTEDWTGCKILLQQVIRDWAYEPYTGMAVLDPSGAEVCSSIADGAPIQASDRPWFQKLLSTKDFTVGGFQIGRHTGRPNIPFAFPVIDENGRLRSVIVAAMGVSWIGEAIGKAHLSEDAIALVIDRKGLVLVRYPETVTAVGQRLGMPWLGEALDRQGEGYWNGRGPDGVERMFGYAPLENTGGTVLVGLPLASAVFSDTAGTTAWAWWLALIGTAAVVSLWLAVVLVLIPLHHLKQAGCRWADGAVGTRVGRISGARDLRELGRVFDRMAEAQEKRGLELNDSRRTFDLLINSVGEGVCGIDLSGCITFANAEILRLTGWSAEEFIGGSLDRLIRCANSGSDQHGTEDCPISRACRTGICIDVADFTIRRRDGSSSRIEYTITPIPGIGGPVGAIVVFRDISARKAAEEKRRQSEAKFRLLFDTANDAIFIHDPQGRFLEVNETACRRLGYSREELLQMTPEAINSPASAGMMPDRVRRLVHEGFLIVEAEHLHRNGCTIPTEISSRMVEFDGRTAALSIARDITERKRAEAQLHYLAHYDALTDLPNRMLFLDRLTHALLLAKRRQGRVALLYVDLDGFKAVNDSLGHGFGDRLLRMAAQRMLSCLRESDTAGRLGGDEFAVILPNTADDDFPSVMAAKIIAALDDPFHIDGRSLAISGSIGISLYPDDAATAEDMLRAGHIAMRQAKQAASGLLGLAENLAALGG